MMPSKCEVSAVFEIKSSVHSYRKLKVRFPMFVYKPFFQYLAFDFELTFNVLEHLTKTQTSNVTRSL